MNSFLVFLFAPVTISINISPFIILLLVTLLIGIGVFLYILGALYALREMQ